jgi:hypothetical protein
LAISIQLGGVEPGYLKKNLNFVIFRHTIKHYYSPGSRIERIKNYVKQAAGAPAKANAPVAESQLVRCSLSHENKLSTAKGTAHESDLNWNRGFTDS